MAASGLGKVERSTLRERCLVSLRSAITTGRLGPGDHLNEVALAASLGVSRATIREALRQLQGDGLVVARSRGMLRVREIGADEIRELYAARAALEALAAETLAARPDRDSAIRALETAIGRLGAAEGDLPAQVEADLAFHLLLCELSGNATLLRLWRALEGPVRITIMHAGLGRALHNMAAARHRPIVAAISAGDTVASRTVIVRHMADAADRLVSPDRGRATA